MMGLPEPLHDVVDEVDRIGLRVAPIDLECPNPRRVIDALQWECAYRKVKRHAR